MHSKKSLLLAVVTAGGIAPAIAWAAPAAPTGAAPVETEEEAAAQQPPPRTDLPAPDDPSSAPRANPPPPSGQQPPALRPPIAPPWYEGPATQTAPPPADYAPRSTRRQRRDPEDPRFRSTNVAGPPPAAEIGPPRPGRPATPQYLITSTTPTQPTVRAETPDSATAAAKRINANGPATPKSNTEDLIQGARTNVNFYELVDEMLDEIAYELSKQDATAMSPLAIRLVRLSPDVRPEFAGTLEARLLARVSQATNVRMAVCIECNAMRSRVENGQWLVTLGAVRQEDLQRIGRAQGIKTFLDLSFTFNPQSNVIWMEAVAFRASDGGVVWSTAYRSNATTAMLLRTGRRIPSRSERLEELEHKIQGRPYFGYMVAVGLARLSYNGPTGDIMGPLMTVRIHERFGEGEQQLFGLSVGIFFTGVPKAGTNVLNSLMSGAYYSINLSEPSLNRPELWVYGELGGMFSGNQGNTFYGEAGLDLHLKWRFSMVGGLQYLLPTTFADHDLGGLGYRLRLALNW
jgi:hypothetical protein